MFGGWEGGPGEALLVVGCGGMGAVMVDAEGKMGVRGRVDMVDA